jgi:Lon protease-like protein
VALLERLAGRGAGRVPIFPLQVVLFPGGVLQLRIFEARYMDMARECLRNGTPFGVCLIVEGQEVGAPAVPAPVGCLARIAECDMEELGILKVRAEGTERFRIVASEVERSGLVVARVEPIGEEVPAPDAPGLAECAKWLERVMAAIDPARFGEARRFDDASWVSFRLAEVLPIRNDVRQKLLEVTDAAVRIGVLHRFLRQQELL